MRLVDANILVYAFEENFEQHERASQWLDRHLADSIPLGLPWPSLLTFTRLVTNPRIFERPIGMKEAWRQVEGWLACPSVWIPLPTARHGIILRQLLSAHAIRSELVPDAHLAALAMEHGLAVASADADFSRFEGLRWENPLA